MSRVAIINVDMHGHVNPTLGFTEELVGRGHDVLFFASAEFADKVSATGARFVAYDCRFRQMALGNWLAHKRGDPTAMVANVDRLLDEVETTLPVLKGHLEREKPDVLVYDSMSAAGRILAENSEVPTVKFFTTYASNAHFDLTTQGAGVRYKPDPEIVAGWMDRLARVCAAQGCRPVILMSPFSGDRLANLVLLPRGFQPCGETFDERYHFVGPCLQRARVGGAGAILPPGRDPLIVISLGTLFHEWPELYRTCIEVFRGKRWRVAMSVGPKVDPRSLGEIPPNMVVRHTLPQVELLAEAAVFVSHAGMNSIMEALSFGVPIIAIPQAVEQDFSARRLVEFGVAEQLPREAFTPERLLASVERVVHDARVAAALERMRADIRQAGGTPRAVELIETLAGARA